MLVVRWLVRSFGSHYTEQSVQLSQFVVLQMSCLVLILTITIIIIVGWLL